MPSDPRENRIRDAACLLLAVIQAVMLAALFFNVDPHPPRTTPLFAMAPFLAVSIGTALSAIRLGAAPGGRALAALSAAFALFSFGPQKYFDAAFAEIWIAVIASQIAVIAIVATLVLDRLTETGTRHAT